MYFVCCFFHTFIHSYLQPYNLLKWLKKTCCVVLFVVVILPLFFLSAGFFSFYFGCVRIRLQFSSFIFFPKNFMKIGSQTLSLAFPPILLPPNHILAARSLCSSICKLWPPYMFIHVHICLELYAYRYNIIMGRKLRLTMDRLRFGQPTEKKSKDCFMFSVHDLWFRRSTPQYQHSDFCGASNVLIDSEVLLQISTFRFSIDFHATCIYCRFHCFLFFWIHFSLPSLKS